MTLAYALLVHPRVFHAPFNAWSRPPPPASLSRLGSMAPPCGNVRRFANGWDAFHVSPLPPPTIIYPIRCSHSGARLTLLFHLLYNKCSYPSGYGGGLEIHCDLHAQVRVLLSTLFTRAFCPAIFVWCAGRWVSTCP